MFEKTALFSLRVYTEAFSCSYESHYDLRHTQVRSRHVRTELKLTVVARVGCFYMYIEHYVDSDKSSYFTSFSSTISRNLDAELQGLVSVEVH